MTDSSRRKRPRSPATRWLAGAVLLLAAVPPTGAVRVSAAVRPSPVVRVAPSRPAPATPRPPVYSLAATVAPPAMREADCTGSCVVAPAPSGADDQPALQNLVDAAAAVPATVLLRRGTYRLGRPLVLPPGVDLRGAGITLTTVRMIAADFARFDYGFLITWAHEKTEHPGAGNLVSDLTLNGNCRAGAGAPVPATRPGRPGKLCDFRRHDTRGRWGNVGGGIAVGNHWTVRQVRFTNLNYFKVWASDGVQDVHLTDNRFDNWGGAESGPKDNVGGGRNDGVVVEYNQFDRTIRGNSVDFANAVRTTIRHNTVLGDATVADARPDRVPSGNMYLEGVVRATVADNVLWGAQISVKTNSGYGHSGNNRDITNPRDTVITGNHVSYPTGVGISLSYDDYRDRDGTPGTVDDPRHAGRTTGSDHIVRPGGHNVIRDNVVAYAGSCGIVVSGTFEHAKSLPDTITGNTVADAGRGRSGVYDSGAGLFDTAGIGLSIGTGDRISGNTITGRATRYGIDLGARRAPTSPKRTVVGANRTAGVTGAAVHRPAPGS